ncbi:MAG TPA: mechanosensitive ion channel family protein [Terracidiphilus sp.]|nr:mechanosensitive ion channel family protein [Terracidiphilus sp.]
MPTGSIRSACIVAISIACLLAGLPLYAGPTAAQTKPASVPQAPVMLSGKTLFAVEGALSFTAQARADAISQKLEGLSKDVYFKPQAITASDANGVTNILAGDIVIMSVTDQDARDAGSTRQILGKEYAHRITTAMIQVRHEYSLKSLLLGLLYAVLTTLVFVLLLRLLGVFTREVRAKLESWRGTVIPSLRIQKFEILPADRIADFAIGLINLVRLALAIIAIYACTSLVLGYFPWTRGYADALLGYVLSPLRLALNAAFGYLPNVFYILVILVIAASILKVIRVLFTEVGKGTIAFPNFYPEWAEPTYKIVRFLVFALTIVVVFPYLPGYKSTAFQGVSIFLGVLLSLGSTSAVANVVSGIILTYMRAFKIGDRVKIADTMGDVVEKTLLVTRVRTIKNVDVTITNSMVLSSHIVNFSVSAERGGLILHTSVTIGYDAPWRTVHQLLIEAALECEDILRQPRPFVYQTALDDFYVHYEINAYTETPSHMIAIYSDLHQNIQDKFNEAGVEIMSSHYANVRDGNRATIPDQYLPKDYQTPSFSIGLRDLKDAGPGQENLPKSS